MRIAICDNEARDIDSLIKLLKKYFMWNIPISMFANGLDFLASFDKRPNYDVIFLEIDMPGMNGIDVARSIREQDESMKIIFVSNTEKHAVLGYSVNACRYLIKPVKFVDIKDALDSVIKNQNPNETILTYKTRTVIYRIPISTIVYIKKRGKKTEWHLMNGSMLATNLLIKDITNMAILEDFMIVPHQSFVVNLTEVRTIHKVQQKIELSDGAVVPIARGRLQTIIDRYQEYWN